MCAIFPALGFKNTGENNFHLLNAILTVETSDLLLNYYSKAIVGLNYCDSKVKINCDYHYVWLLFILLGYKFRLLVYFKAEFFIIDKKNYYLKVLSTRNTVKWY